MLNVHKRPRSLEIIIITNLADLSEVFHCSGVVICLRALEVLLSVQICLLRSKEAELEKMIMFVYLLK